MFTVKLIWRRVEAHDPARFEGPPIDNEVDYATRFLLADRVSVCGGPDPDMTAWAPGEFADHRSVLQRRVDGQIVNEPFDGSRLIEVECDGETQWLLVTQAWLLGPTGDTIERLAP